jgi:hypothetical protein
MTSYASLTDTQVAKRLQFPPRLREPLFRGEELCYTASQPFLNLSWPAKNLAFYRCRLVKLDWPGMIFGEPTEVQATTLESCNFRYATGSLVLRDCLLKGVDFRFSRLQRLVFSGAATLYDCDFGGVPAQSLTIGRDTNFVGCLLTTVAYGLHLYHVTVDDLITTADQRSNTYLVWQEKTYHLYRDASRLLRSAPQFTRLVSALQQQYPPEENDED